MAEDNVVLAQYGYGRTDGADGRVWPWVFNAASHYWSQIAVKMKFMAEQEGGIDKMKGKKIVPRPLMKTFDKIVIHKTYPFYLVTQSTGNHGIAVIAAVTLMIEYYSKLDTRLGSSIWKYSYDYHVVGKRDVTLEDDKNLVILRRKRNRAVTFM